jgi:hypothetical protein
MPAASMNLTKDQAIKAVSALISLPEKAELQDASYNENVGDLKVMGGGAPTWNLNWIVKGEKASDSEYINASINSKTGQLVSYSHNTNMPLKRRQLILLRKSFLNIRISLHLMIQTLTT